MNYMTPEEAAKKWCVSLRRVQFLCSSDRIPGARQLSRRWLIPVNAVYPQRASRKEADRQLAQGSYRFPFLLFTDYYAAGYDLSTEERQLLQAQLLFARGRREESLALCHELDSSEVSSHIKFGACFTIVCVSIPLGLYNQVMLHLAKMEAICQAAGVHRADYRLLIAICRFQFTYEVGPLAALDISALSPQALTAYKFISLQAAILTTDIESPTALKIYDAFCQDLENTGNLPPACLIHAILGLFHGRAGNRQAERAHIDQACRIGCQQGYYEILTKYSSLAPAEFRECLAKYDGAFLKRLDGLRMQNQLKWRIVYNAARGELLFPDCSADEADFLMLLSYGMANKKISVLKNASSTEIRKIIQKLCNKLGFQTKAQLVTYTKKLFREA